MPKEHFLHTSPANVAARPPVKKRKIIPITSEEWLVYFNIYLYYCNSILVTQDMVCFDPT